MAKNLGTYSFVCDGRMSFISEKDVAEEDSNLFAIHFSPQLYAAIASSQLPNMLYKVFKYFAAAIVDLYGSLLSSM